MKMNRSLYRWYSTTRLGTGGRGSSCSDESSLDGAPQRVNNSSASSVTPRETGLPLESVTAAVPAPDRGELFVRPRLAARIASPTEMPKNQATALTVPLVKRCPQDRKSTRLNSS